MFGQVVFEGVTILGMADHKIVTGTKTEKSFELWAQIGAKLIEKWVTKIVFDRNGYLYHGRIKSMCEWVRSSGVII